MDYKSTKALVELRAKNRFDQKRVGGWRGWHRASYNKNMRDRAVEKLNRLAGGKCKDPIKEAADVMNFAIFMAAQQIKVGN